MRTLIWSNAFTRSFKGWMHKRPDLHNDVAEVLRLLVVNRACSAGYDLRIVFDFVKAEKGSADDILLLAIGTHDEVY
ncbi:MAG: type II toxin-antitoxin system mRNA interferase toxin, RelE/StbE family [Deltaproteobacteria bacterium]|nr:type II toxin-antitoxin system mRNA interferase toxin, RelE/StbE family [Deltaproteobacteria bacterium]